MFDVTGQDISFLSDEDLRTLVGRLCEAELRRLELSPLCASWGGNQNAADGGVDVRVTLSGSAPLSSAFVRPNVGYQVKAEDMPRGKILAEMKPNGIVRPSIQEFAAAGGSYIIVSSKGSVSDSALTDRRCAMCDAVADIANCGDLHLDFYDRDRLASWVRDHASIVTWVRERIGRPISGWRPYDDWGASHEGVPITIVGAGLPQLRGRMGEAKSYAERLFDFPEIGALSPLDSRDAIVRPVLMEGAEIENAAADLIVEKTQGYPYFLQEWGKHTWDVAQSSPIQREDVLNASNEAVAALDESFFRVRFDRLTTTEKKYLRAMAELGPGPHRSGDIADQLQRTVQSLGPIRAGLISKGMMWSPTHGDTAFTVPLFDEFMRRIMPGEDWKTIGN